VRRVLIVLGLALALAAPAAGQPAPDPAPAAPAPPPVVDDEVIPTPPKSSMRQPEMLREKPSGFWTSNVPARGGAYRYRLMGIGLCVFALSAFFTIRFLRKVNRTRTAA
jgi:hypothetical protein